jgi:hypothetical protein
MAGVSRGSRERSVTVPAVFVVWAFRIAHVNTFRCRARARE